MERPEEGKLIKEATDIGAKNITQHHDHEPVQSEREKDNTIENMQRAVIKNNGWTRFT